MKKLETRIERVTYDRVRQITELSWGKSCETNWVLRKCDWVLTVDDTDYGLYDNTCEALYALLSYTNSEPRTWKILQYIVLTDEAALFPIAEKDLDTVNLPFTDFTRDPGYTKFCQLLDECYEQMDKQDNA